MLQESLTKRGDLDIKEDNLVVNLEANEVDRVLTERAINGNKLAFKSLVEKYQNKAVGIAFGIIGNIADAEEIAQEAFLKAYKNLGSFRGQSSFYTWFYRIVFNLSIDLSRKKYRKNESSVGDLYALDSSVQNDGPNMADFVGAPLTPEQLLSNARLGVEIERALSSLSAEHRAIIILREIQGLSYDEISDVLGCSKGTVMSRLHHARKRLQAALAPFYFQKE